MSEKLNWMTVLREHRDSHGNGPTAEKIGYSATTVSQVLSNKYKGDLSAIQKAVEGGLMGMTVQCPVVGEMPRNVCLDYQRRVFQATNPLRVQLNKACPKCPNRRGAV